MQQLGLNVSANTNEFLFLKSGFWRKLLCLKLHIMESPLNNF